MTQQPPQARPTPAYPAPSPSRAAVPMPSLMPASAGGASPVQPMPQAAPQLMPQPVPPQPMPAMAPQRAPLQPVAAPPMPPMVPIQGVPEQQPRPNMPPVHGVPMQNSPQAMAPSMLPMAAPLDDDMREGGEKALPKISIHAFCDRSETAASINGTTHDWRMKRTNMKIFMGGLLAAIEFYHKESTPNLIIIESGMRGPELFAQLEQLASVCDSGTKVVMVGAANDIKLYRQLMERGVSDYIVPPFHPLTLIRSISDLYADPEKPFVGRSIAFYGGKGGNGSSTLAHNIAWILAEKIGQETALVDMDESFGTTGLDFAYDSSQGLEEALAEPDRLDETLLDRIMLRHTPKLSILPTAGSLHGKPRMISEAYESVVNGVRSISPLTILDLPHYWMDWTVKLLTNADDVVITATPDLANLRNTKNLIDFLKAERPNDVDPILILNKTGMSKDKEISVKEFGAAVGLNPAIYVDFNPEVFFEAANDGKMLTEVKGADQAVEDLKYVAHRLKTGQFPAPMVGVGKGKSLLSRKNKAAKNKAEKPEGGSQSLFAKLKNRK